MSFLNKAFDKVYDNKNEISLYDSDDVWDAYYMAYLMSQFDKNVQTSMFLMYRITDMCESYIADIPNDIKNGVTNENIQKEYAEQYAFCDEYDELDIDNFQNANKDWDIEHDRLSDSLIEWISSFENLIVKMDEIVQYISDLKTDKLPQAIENGKTAISYNEIDTKSQNIIKFFYKAAPILFRFCKLNILDIYNNTNRYNRIMADYESILDELNSYLKPFEKK